MLERAFEEPEVNIGRIAGANAILKILIFRRWVQRVSKWQSGGGQSEPVEDKFELDLFLLLGLSRYESGPRQKEGCLWVHVATNLIVVSHREACRLTRNAV